MADIEAFPATASRIPNSDDRVAVGAINGSGSAWGWLPLALLLGVSVTWFLSETTYISAHLPFLLPLMMGWWGRRFGASALWPALTIALLSTVVVDVIPADALHVILGFTDQAPVALAAFLVGLYSHGLRHQVSSDARMGPQWLLATILFLLAVVGSYELEYADLAGFADLRINAGIGATLIILALGARMQRRSLNMAWRTSSGRMIAVLGLCVSLVLLVALLFDGRVDLGEYDSDSLLMLVSVWIGLSSHGVILAFSFMITATKMLSWRYATVALLLSLPTHVLIWLLGATAEPVPILLNQYVSAALLGALVSTWWCGCGSSRLRGWPTPALLAVILVLQFFGGRVSATYYTLQGDIVVLGGVAFVAALVWRGKGLVAMPTMILLLTLLAHATGPEQIRGDVISVLVHVGFFIFPYAFIGLLASEGHSWRLPFGFSPRRSASHAEATP
jgi:hypothetical protein